MKSWHKVAVLIAVVFAGSFAFEIFSTSKNIHSLHVTNSGDIVANIRGAQQELLRTVKQPFAFQDESVTDEFTIGHWTIESGHCTVPTDPSEKRIIRMDDSIEGEGAGYALVQCTGDASFCLSSGLLTWNAATSRSGMTFTPHVDYNGGTSDHNWIRRIDPAGTTTGTGSGGFSDEGKEFFLSGRRNNTDVSILMMYTGARPTTCFPE